MNVNQRQRKLIKKYLLGDITDQERQEVNLLISDPENKNLFDDVMDELILDLLPETKTEQDELNDKLLAFKTKYAIPMSEQEIRTGFPKKWGPYIAAAAVLIMVSFGLLFHLDNGSENQKKLAQKGHQIVPGSDKALLTLADGSTIALSDAKSGKLADQFGVHVEKTAAGEIVYHSESQAAVRSLAFNKVSTPKGGQYRIILPDGSKAWLNAASSLSYPTRFDQRERRVKMTGEVYFEVAKIKRPHSHETLPFVVETDKQLIQVLGTQFNINAYQDEPTIRTTLVEGSVRVTSSLNGASVLLKPGQESLLSDKLSVHTADIQQQLAWKNGEFVFKGEDLDKMLKQLARWYDLEINCPSQYSKIKFTGIISRSIPLSSIVDMIESTKEVKIKIAGRRLTVSD
ncbi:MULTISPECIES: FecR family protein [Sphingobacterium]|uniref:FecR family protein n=1 Tax=Sphingobacterium TaxID=28453 RepID=UPI00257B79CA|nr:MULTISPECIES: FecR family protein [Sphingobacterium]